MNGVLSVMRSVRFNVALIAVLAGLFALGTFIPQRNDAPQEVEKFFVHNPQLAPILDRLGFFALYHTPLVIFLMVLLAADIIVCRVWPLAKEIKAGLHSARSRLIKWGSFVNHMGLVVVLVGCLMKALWGFEEFVMLIPGQDKPLQRFPSSTLSLFNFKVDFYQGTQTPKLFQSDMQFSMDGVTRKAQLRVNEPLSFPLSVLAPLRFYQASWGATGMFHGAELELGKGQSVRLRMNEPVKITGTPFTVSARMMLPDFFITAAGTPDTKSLDWKNPALSVVFEHQGYSSPPIWLLLHQPGVAFKEGPDGRLEHVQPPPFRVSSIDPVFFSGIQAAYDPGFPVVISGVLMILSGFFLMGYAYRPKAGLEV